MPGSRHYTEIVVHLQPPVIDCRVPQALQGKSRNCCPAAGNLATKNSGRGMSPLPVYCRGGNGEARAGAGHSGSVEQKQEVDGRSGAGGEESLLDILLHIHQDTVVAVAGNIFGGIFEGVVGLKARFVPHQAPFHVGGDLGLGAHHVPEPQLRHVPDAVIAGEEQAVAGGQVAGGGGLSDELAVQVELEVIGAPGGVIGEGQVAPDSSGTRPCW